MGKIRSLAVYKIPAGADKDDVSSIFVEDDIFVDELKEEFGKKDLYTHVTFRSRKECPTALKKCEEAIKSEGGLKIKDTEVEVEEATYGYAPPLSSGFRHEKSPPKKQQCWDDHSDEENRDWDKVDGYSSPDDDDD
ncbi:uncharacterized protein LOC141668640 [Apium graveolens]|uniref:uncharacterized protein LOC141668640 n=1 Tax=Apium graveolens TaxID=4045 RepID=UPI003D791D1D